MENYNENPKVKPLAEKRQQAEQAVLNHFKTKKGTERMNSEYLRMREAAAAAREEWWTAWRAAQSR